MEQCFFMAKQAKATTLLRYLALLKALIRPKGWLLVKLEKGSKCLSFGIINAINFLRLKYLVHLEKENTLCLLIQFRFIINFSTNS